MSGIVELLKAFDRKERAWLVRMALKPAALDQGFLNKVSEVLPLKPTISPDAWWGMDYHIDWLTAALHAFEKGWSVDELTAQKSMTNDDALMKHSIQDFDFIIADKQRIILIEAKAFGDWDDEQLKSKLKRLKQLEKPEKSEKPEELRMISKEGVVTRNATAKCALAKTVQLHLILTSITDRLPVTPESCTPAWALTEPRQALEKDRMVRSPAWIELDTTFNKPPTNRRAKRIARWDETTKMPSKDGKTWKIMDEKNY